MKNLMDNFIIIVDRTFGKILKKELKWVEGKNFLVNKRLKTHLEKEYQDIKKFSIYNKLNVRPKRRARKAIS